MNKKDIIALFIFLACVIFFGFGIVMLGIQQKIDTQHCVDKYHSQYFEADYLEVAMPVCKNVLTEKLYPW